ncbi:hypothetical protein JR316_0010425 [Psilocybe cubensis]|uniref:Uncharacterized protein n=1 Tax=Psilocybe cubensis TaxID=181762 RepID=A0ACB8GLK1_PSICU|nr:hypothetical protein JR316_0010425 [Psilocybe cubensis]KAH9476513.1 hypothetical protein JR316_0010425 [Psilocybe cubensis]
MMVWYSASVVGVLIFATIEESGAVENTVTEWAVPVAAEGPELGAGSFSIFIGARFNVSVAGVITVSVVVSKAKWEEVAFLFVLSRSDFVVNFVLTRVPVVVAVPIVVAVVVGFACLNFVRGNRNGSDSSEEKGASNSEDTEDILHIVVLMKSQETLKLLV